MVYSFDPEKKEIHRKKGKDDAILEDLIVASYDPETKIVQFNNLNDVLRFKTGVITFLSENEMDIREFQRKDIRADKRGKSLPPRPKKNKHEGDKTPLVVEWYHRHKFNEFCTRYGVIEEHYSGPVSYLEPKWEPRPVDGMLEYRGVVRYELNVTDVMIATRAVCDSKGDRLTYTPDECPDYSEDDFDSDSPRRLASSEVDE